MAPPTLEFAVYSFEGLLPDLESPPIAARRALDQSGIRLSVEGWRSLSADERQKVTLAGVAERVDAERIASLIRRASPAPKSTSPVADPDPAAPPEALVKALEPNRTIDARRWARLRSIDRYALAHTYRRAVARSAFSLLCDAFDAVLAQTAQKPADGGYPQRSWAAGGSVLPPPPAPGASKYEPAGYYSSVTPPPGAAEPATASAADPPESSPFTRAAGTPTTRMRATPHPETGNATGARGGLSVQLTQAGEVHLTDVTRKPKTERRAVATGSLWTAAETVTRLIAADGPRAEVFATARIAGIMAAKRTHEILPACHPVTLTHLELTVELDEAGSSVHVTAVAHAYDRTGCETEAMVAVSAACLTLYDMLKGLDRGIVIGEVKLMEKSGGRSGHYERVGP